MNVLARRTSRLGVAVGCVLAVALGARADNNVRSVRFTLVSGAVQVKLPGETRWHPAMLDAPLVAGEQVQTLSSGRAEVQLENGSTLRLISGSTLDFPVLSRDDKGRTSSLAVLTQGSALVSLRAGDAEGFALKLDDSTQVRAAKGAAYRAAAGGVAVMNGSAEVIANGAAPVRVKNGEQLALAHGRPAGPPTVWEAERTDPWVQWSQRRDDAYEAALHHGIEPAGMAPYVNWNASLSPMPTYTDASLNYTGNQACPWTMATGDYAGWCWNPTQGWYLPTGAVPAVGLQTVAWSPWGGGFCDSNALFFADPFYGGVPSCFGYASGYDSLVLYNGTGGAGDGGGLVGGGTPPVPPNGWHGRGHPGKGSAPILPARRGRYGRLGPPPERAIRTAGLRAGPQAGFGLRSGVQVSHTNFHVAAFRAGDGSMGRMVARNGFSGGNARLGAMSSGSVFRGGSSMGLGSPLGSTAVTGAGRASGGISGGATGGMSGGHVSSGGAGGGVVHTSH